MGLDHFRTRDDSEIAELLAAHLAALREQPFLEHARIVALFESNLGTQSSSLAAKLLEDDPTAHVACSNYEQYGVHTGLRDTYVQHMAGVLAQGRLVCHERLVSANPWRRDMSPAARASEARATQYRQLASFRTEMVRSVDGARRHLRHTVSAHMIDDLAIVSMLGPFWAAEHIERRLRVRTAATRIARVNSSFARAAPIVRHSEYDTRPDGPASRAPKRPTFTNEGSLAKRARQL